MIAQLAKATARHQIRAVPDNQSTIAVPMGAGCAAARGGYIRKELE